MFDANLKVAKALDEMAKYVKEAGDKNRSFAFSKAANAIRYHDRDVADQANLQGIKGVGASTIAIATEVLNTGTCARLEELKQRYEIVDTSELERIPGVGPVKAKKIYAEFGVKTLADLRRIVDEGRFSDEKVITSLEFVERSAEYTPRPWAEAAGARMIEILRPLAYQDRITFAGSIRRKKDLVRDIDILICCECTPQDIYNAITAAGGFVVQYGGEQKIRVEYTLFNGQAMGGDVVITTPKEWPFALCYLTGSKEFAPGLRGHALSRGYTLNEHRLENTTTHEHVEGIETEEDLFRFLGLPYIPPECRRAREDAGVDFSGIILQEPEGELHTHTSDWSDGADPVRVAVKIARNRGWTFYGVSDHTKALPHGVAADQMGVYAASIRTAGEEFGINVYVGLELDINAAHQTVYSYEALKPHLDYAILAIHHAIGSNMVSRYIAAIEQMKDIPLILAHVTGRLFGQRDIPEDDWARLFKKCAEKGVLIEINGQPDRLDPPVHLIKMAQSFGCKFILATDYHGADPDPILENAYYIARSAALCPKDMVRTNRDVKAWIRMVKEAANVV